MGNKIHIQVLNNSLFQNIKGKEETNLFTFPITEDPTIAYASEFGTKGEEIPLLNKIRSGTQLVSALSNETSTTLTDVVNFMDVPTWQKTSPASFTVELFFYTETDPYKDVWLPMRKLISLTILLYKDKKGGAFIVPGVSLLTASLAKNSNEEDVMKKIGKAGTLVSVSIPGIIFLCPAFIRSASPTYSKQVTESGYPLWGKLSISVEGIYPATSEIFDKVEQPIKDKALTKTGTAKQTGIAG